ncbi:MAG: response regulator, partial [Hyphomicrobiaceae bacterium]
GAPEKRPAGAYGRVAGSDPGRGQSPKTLGHAFEPLVTTPEPGRGPGLGLSTILGLAEQSGGTATIYSELGVGTTVSIYLPRLDDGCERSSGERAEEERQGEGETVLVVEDNGPVREITCQRLGELGYQVIEAENAPSALEIIESGTPVDIVFSDIFMPGGMSGHQLAVEVRRRWPRIATLLTSGFADGLFRGRYESGATSIPPLSKPYSRGELARAIRRALAETREARAQPRTSAPL